MFTFLCPSVERIILDLINGSPLDFGYLPFNYSDVSHFEEAYLVMLIPGHGGC